GEQSEGTASVFSVPVPVPVPDSVSVSVSVSVPDLEILPRIANAPFSSSKLDSRGESPHPMTLHIGFGSWGGESLSPESGGPSLGLAWVGCLSTQRARRFSERGA